MAVKSPTLLYDSDNILKATSVLVTSSYGNKLQASNYSKSVANIDASERTKNIKITGNDKNNSIIGGAGNDTLDGGKGNDTLTGGAGADVFIYSSDNDIITDYTAGEDTIKISGGSISGYSVSGDDVILTVGTGSLKIQGGNNDAITIKDSKNKVSVYQDGLIYNNANIEKATGVTISSNYENENLVADTAIITLDASTRTKAVDIEGNKKNNKILGGNGNDILSGGTGNDTLTGGKGKDTFVYESGNDVITDYTENEDTISLSAGVEIVNYSVSGKDLTVKTNTKGSIKIKNGKTQTVKFSDGTNSAIYQNGLIYDGTDTSKSKTVSITSNYGKEFENAGSSVVSLDASTRNAAIKITGNSKDNHITGSNKNDTITGGAGKNTINGSAGNDVLIGGTGKNIYLYANGDGKDTIQNYSAGSDSISLAGDYEVSYSADKKGNATFKIGKGSITLKDGADSSVTIVGANGEASIGIHGSFFAVKDIPDIKVVEVTLPPVTLPAETVTVYETVTIHDTVEVPVTVTVPGENETVTVYGSGESIKGTSAAETLYGTAGNDTFTGGAGADVFIYEGGFDIIEDYGTGKDIISIGSNSVSNYGVIGNDGIFFVGGGALKLTGAKDKKVTLISSGKETEYDLTNTSTNPTVPAGKTVTLKSSYEGDFSLTAYNSTLSANETVSNVDASNVRNEINIYGDYNDNIIYFGNSYDGSSKFYYKKGDGNDTIYNFQTGDELQLYTWEQQVKDISLSGKDIIVNLKTGNTITLKDVQKQKIFIDDWGSDKYSGYMANLTMSGKSVTLNSDYTGDFKSEWYDATPTTIDASQVTGDVDIYGSTGNDTIYAGKNYNGSTKIYYKKGDGNDTIYNILDNDEIHLEDCEAKSVSVNGNDVVITIQNTNETITLKDGTGKHIWISGQDWQTYTSGTSARVAEENIWFLEDDNNFVGGNINFDSLIKNNSPANLNPVETENIFAQDNSFIAYNSEQKK